MSRDSQCFVASFTIQMLAAVITPQPPITPRISAIVILVAPTRREARRWLSAICAGMIFYVAILDFNGRHMTRPERPGLNASSLTINTGHRPALSGIEPV